MSSSSHVINYRRPWWKAARCWWPLLVVGFFVWFSFFLHERGGRYRVMRGTVERMIEGVAPLEAARVTHVDVEVGDALEAGDTIARLDTSVLDAEIAALREGMLQSRLEAKLNKLTLERQFAGAVQEAASALAGAEFAGEMARVELGMLEEELRRMEPLLQQNLIQAGELAEAKSRAGLLRQQLKLAPERLEVLRADLARAQEQQGRAREGLAEVDALVAGAKEEETLALLNTRKEGYTLRAFQKGTVAELNHQPGDVVPAGDVIARLLIDGPCRVVGFLPENNLSTIQVGSKARIFPSVSLDKTGILPARVLQISPAVYSLPERVSPIRGQVVRGRRVTFALDENADLTPGESVSIELLGN